MAEEAAATPVERGAFFYFDVLRAVAAGLVVLEHLRDLIWLPAAEARPASIGFKLVYFISGFGAEAVTAFFVLSGFWIAKTVERRRFRDDFWSRYLFDRLTRLWIVILPALLLGALLDAYARFVLDAPLYRGATDTISLAYDVAPRLTPLVFLGNAAFLQTVIVPTFGSNGPLWSLANEFWYYVWFPALMLLIARRRLSLWLGSMAVGIVAPHLLIGFAVWLLGSALAYFDGRWTVWGQRWRGWSLGATVAVLVATMTFARLGYLGDDLATLVVGAAFALFAWSILRVDPRPLRGTRVLARYGGGSSFSLYAAHFPLLALIAALLLPSRRMAPSGGALILLAVLFAVALAWGWVFSLATERQTGRIRSAWSSRIDRHVRLTAEESV